MRIKYVIRLEMKKKAQIVVLKFKDLCIELNQNVRITNPSFQILGFMYSVQLKM